MADRTEVPDPFTLGIRPGARVAAAPNLASQALPRSAFQAKPDLTASIVDSLVKFAGVTGDLFVKQTAKRVEADKLVQMDRAMKGIAPSDKATVAGVRSHSVVGVQNQTLQASARLSQLAQTRVSDDKWEEAIRTEAAGIDADLRAKYPTYSNDPEMQALASLSMREAMPSLTMKREANKVKFEIDDRIGTVKDVLINASKVSDTLTSDIMLKQFTTAVSGLQLTEGQKDKAFIDAIITTKDPKLITASKNYKGERDASLYERTGIIQKIDKANFNQALTDNSIKIARKVDTIDKGVISGTMTRDEAEIQYKALRVPGSHVVTVFNKADKAQASEVNTTQIKMDIVDPTVVNLDKYKDKEINNTLVSMDKDEQARIFEDAKALPPEQQAEFIRTERDKSIRRLGDQSTKVGFTVNSWTSELNNLANLNMPADITSMSVNDFKVNMLSPTAQAGLQKYEALSVSAREEYLDSMGSREAKTLRAFAHFKELGISMPQALDRAQTFAKNPQKPKKKDVDEAVEWIVDDQQWMWRDDIPESQASYINSEVRSKIELDPEPNSKLNKEVVKNWMNSKWTLAGDFRLKGSPQELERATGINTDKMEEAIQGYMFSMTQTVLPQIDALGLSMEDVFPVTNAKQGWMELVAAGAPIPGTRIPLTDLTSVRSAFLETQKVKKELESGEEFKELTSKQGRGPVPSKRGQRGARVTRTSGRRR